MIEVEVRGQYGQFIKASLKNLVKNDVIVTYLNSKSEEKIPLSKVRLPPSPSRDVQAGEDAEVLFVVSDSQSGAQFGDTLVTLNDNGTSKSEFQNLPEEERRQLSFAAWWPCRVQKVRDDVAAVKLHVIPPPNASSDDVARCTQLSNITDIVTRNTLRPITNNIPYLNANMIHRHSIEIPKELADFAADPSVHSEFLKHCGEPISSYFDADTCSLIVLSTDENTICKVPLLEETHVKMLRQKWAITRTLRQTIKSIETNRGHNSQSKAPHRATGDWEIDPNHHVEKFYVPQHLMGLAIGAQGSNIRSAREIPGVVYIRLEDSGEASRRGAEGEVEDATLFIVEARTADAAKQARAKLEFTELYLGVPRRYVGRLIGRRTNNILSIIKKSGVVQIHFDDHIKGPADDETVLNLESLNLNHAASPTPSSNMRRVFLQTGSHHCDPQSRADDEYGGFILLGTRESVDKAKLLISFQLDYISDLEKMEAEKSALMRNLSYPNPDARNGYPSRGRVAEWPMGVSARGQRGMRRPPRGTFPPSVSSHPSMSDPEPASYDEHGPVASSRGGRRPPRDPRTSRGYNGDLRSRRQGGRGSARRGGGRNYDFSQTGGNGDVSDRRRRSQDSDTQGSNPSHEEDEIDDVSAPRSRLAHPVASKRLTKATDNDSGYPVEDDSRVGVDISGSKQDASWSRNRARATNGNVDEGMNSAARAQALPPSRPANA